MSLLSGLGVIAAINWGMQWSCFVVAACLQTEKFYDAVGSLSYITMVAYTYFNYSAHLPRQQVVTAFVCLWALRLGSFLLMRVLQHGKDSRFDRVKLLPKIFFYYWTIQGFWSFLVSLPANMLNISATAGTPFTTIDYLGWFLYVAGSIIEVTADYQKYTFSQDKRNQGNFISTGIWSWSRHPNYLGEIILWWGILLATLNGLPTLTQQLVSLVSPFFVTYLLLRLSGIPLLERKADAKWGQKANYVQYKAKTALLVPGLW